MPASAEERQVVRQHLRVLANTSANLANCMDVDQVVETFVSDAHGAVGALNTLVYLRKTPTDEQLQLRAVRGVPPEALRHFETVELNAALPVATAVRAAKASWFSDRAALVQAYPQLPVDGEGQALGVIPVNVNGAVIGTVVFSFPSAKRWDVDEREFFVTLVAQFVAALERARLLQVERGSHQAAERSNAALRLMADVGTLLSSSLDYESVLKRLTEVLVPSIADWCAVDVLGAQGQIQRLAAFHSDPAKIALAHAIEQQYPGDPNAAHGVPNVLRTARTEWMAAIPDELLVSVAKSEEHLALIRRLGLRSYIAVPLQARGRILGVLSLVFAESDRRYTQDDVRFVEELANRAALSVDNAKLFTEQVAAREAVERQSRQALLSADVGTALTRSKTLRDALQRCADALARHLDVSCARIWTLEPEARTLELQASAGIYTDLDGPQARIPVGQLRIGVIAAEREVYVTNSLQTEPDGNPEWADGLSSFAGYPLVVEERVVGVLGLYARRELAHNALVGISAIADTIALGIERNSAEQQARTERDTLSIVNEVGRALAAELDQDKLVQAVTDYATRLSSAAFGAFFYNVVGATGESYMLYSISGVAREAFSKFPMPRNTQVFAPTFAGQGNVRVSDIRLDPRYGHNAPNNGMPLGHLPVASYLAVPVVSRSGEAIGGLFFGHPQPGVFTERHEALVAGVAAQAATAMDNARLFKEAQRLIAQLDRSNQDLDQFAYVASHDLKAPLRGIASVSEWLEEDLSAVVTSSAKDHFALLRNRVQRMEGLINGILDYSRAGRTKAKIEPVWPSKLVAEVVELIASNTAARIEIQADMPELKTERVPLQQVFMNLINNALKHARHPELRIVVSCADAGTGVEFSIRDNGPGIAPQFHDRIWGIFQTLEPRDSVEGTGIGLSVVKKVVESKGGSVRLNSNEGEGATFAFVWPKVEKEERHV